MALRGGYTDAQDALGHTAHGSRCPVPARDRKSTRLNSSHDQISYAVFCLKKKKKKKKSIYNKNLYRSARCDVPAALIRDKMDASARVCATERARRRYWPIEPTDPRTSTDD